MRHPAIPFAVFLLLPQLAVCHAAEKPPIVADPDLQGSIDRAVKAITTRTVRGLEGLAELEKLRATFERRPKDSAEQLLYYVTQAPDVSSGMAAASLFSYFNMQKGSVIESVLPYLESDGPRFREAVYLALRWAEDSRGNRPPDFSCYSNVLRTNMEAPPAALVRYMFKRDPPQALRQFTIVYASPPARQDMTLSRELQWADHMVNDAIRKRGFLQAFTRTPEGPRDSVVTLEKLSREEADVQLEKLSKSDQWWVRLYVAEILRQHREFRTPQMVDRLKRDKHPLVRDAILGHQKPKPARAPSAKVPGDHERGEMDRSPKDSPLRIEPVPEIQQCIQGFLSPPQGKEFSHQQRMREWLGNFRRLAQTEYDILIPQPLYYSMYGQDASGKRDVKEAMAFAIVGEQLRIGKWSIARALLPFFKTTDPELQKALRGLGLDYRSFRALVAGEPLNEGQMAAEFVRSSFREDPGGALLMVARAMCAPPQAEELKALLWAEHVVDGALWRQQHGFLDKQEVKPGAAAQLEKLSRFDQWWVRLYVAEILRQHPEFRTPGMVDRLKADKHELVRRAMDIDEQPKPTPVPRPAVQNRDKLVP